MPHGFTIASMTHGCDGLGYSMGDIMLEGCHLSYYILVVITYQGLHNNEYAVMMVTSCSEMPIPACRPQRWAITIQAMTIGQDANPSMPAAMPWPMAGHGWTIEGVLVITY